MSSTYYSLYEAQVMTLAKTLVIKSVGSAAAINRELTLQGHVVDAHDPTTWKYYQNLCGQYHTTDTPMSVISLDTQEEIAFDVETLKVHVATRANYAYGSSYYKALVRRYPHQSALIKGILNPLDMETVIAAKDYAILYYDPDCVEVQETNLIEQLQSRIDRYAIRYYIKGYAVVEDLYLATHLATLYAMVVPWILNIRLDNCRSRFTHSYHIREYLASHNHLDTYMGYLTIGQKLWLYRNLVYLENNAGKRDTFQWIVDHIITARSLPLGTYRMTHNTQSLPDALLPEIDLTRQGVNKHFSTGIKNVVTLEEVLLDENSLAKGNPEALKDTLTQTTHDFKRSRFNDLPTKVLDSSMTDYSNSGVILESDVLLNHWLVWAVEDLFVSVITVKHPQTGEMVQIPVREAYLLYLYAWHKSMGMDFPEVPVILAKDVRKRPVPTLTELVQRVDRRYVTPELLVEIQTNHPRLQKMVSVDAFRDSARRVYQKAMDQRRSYIRQEHQFTRGLVHGLAEYFYEDYHVDLLKDGEPRDMRDWCVSKGYTFTDLTRLEYSVLAATLVETVTGKKLDGASELEEMQRAMLNITSQLSSYSVQFIQNINRGPIQYMDDPALRLGDMDITGGDIVFMDGVGPGIIGVRGSSVHQFEIDPTGGVDITHQSQHHAGVTLNGYLDIVLDTVTHMNLQTQINHVVYDVTDDVDWSIVSPTP